MHSQMLPAGEEHPCDAGKRQENLPKNRFRTTFPCKNNNTSVMPSIYSIQKQLTEFYIYILYQT